MLLFLQVELRHFSGINYNNVNGQGIPCGRNSFYSLIPILSKLHWCFSHGLKICMWFGYNPQNFFLSLFSQNELSHFSSIIYNKVNGQEIPCGRNSSYSCIPILKKLHWCFGHGLKICLWLRYNPQIIFWDFLEVELSHNSSIIYNKVNGQGIPCGHNSSYSFIPILLKLHWCFGHGLKIFFSLFGPTQCCKWGYQ